MAGKNLLAHLDISQRGPLVLGIVGPLLGLVYIMVLPFIGLVGLILLSLVRARQSLAVAWRRVIHSTVIA